MIKDDNTMNGKSDGTSIFAELSKPLDIPSAQAFGSETSTPKNKIDTIPAIIFLIQNHRFSIHNS